MCVCVSIHIGEYFHHRSDQRGWKAGRGKVGVYHVLNMFGDRIAVGRSLGCGGGRLLAYDFIFFSFRMLQSLSFPYSEGPLSSGL